MLKLFSAAALLGAAFAQNSSSLPTVDLGYEIYRAASFNVGWSLSLAKHKLTIPEHRQFLQLLEHQIRSSTSRRPQVCSTTGACGKQVDDQPWQSQQDMSTGYPSMAAAGRAFPDQSCSWYILQCHYLRTTGCQLEQSSPSSGSSRE